MRVFFYDKISGHARALLALGEPKAILGGLERVVREDLSVRATEKLARTQHQPPAGTSSGEAGTSRSKTGSHEAPAWAQELEDRMRRALGVKTQIHNAEGYRGQVVLSYSDRDELERLVEILAPREEL